jgi:hypothetical protein
MQTPYAVATPNALHTCSANKPHRKGAWLPFALACAGLITLTSGRTATTAAAGRAFHPGVVKAALAFEQNDGQHEAAVRYAARGPGYSVSMLDSGVALALGGNGGRASRVTMTFGRADKPSPSAEAPMEGRANYFVGRNATDWHTNIPTFGRVRYKDAFHGIDVVFYGRDHQLEYDVVVAPGADPRIARITFDGAESLRVDGDGSLALSVGVRELRYSKPVGYQTIGTTQHAVDVQYSVSGTSIGFEPGDYDSTRELVIDPVIVFSTYLGGASNDWINDTVVDGAGNIFVTGGSDSRDFPVAGALQSMNKGIGNAFVSKFSREGALIYSTYFGGSYSDTGAGIDVDPNGAAYVAGTTLSSDLPTTAGAFQPRMNGSNHNGFVLKLNPAGNRIAYLTYLGETSTGNVGDVAVDVSGYATVVGSTISASFPTTSGALDREHAGITRTGFAAKLNTAGTALVYSTFLTGDEQFARGVALDSARRAIVVGAVTGTMAVTKAPVGPLGSSDAFVLKLNPSGTGLVFSTRIGGTDFDTANALVLDGADAPHIVGTTYSSNFPTGNYVFQDRLNGVSDAFVAHLKPDGTIVPYYTGLFGGSGGDLGAGIGISGGYVTLFGETSSPDLPLRDPLQGSFGGRTDAFIARLSFRPELLFGTYLGGTRSDVVRAGVVDGAGIMTMAGFTYSADYPTSNAFQSANRSRSIDYPDGFLTRASLLPRGTPGPRDTVVHVADGATLHGNWVRADDPGAAGGARLHNPDAGAPKLTQPLAAPADYFEVTVNGLYGGPYMVWVRGKADNNSYSNDSVYLQFSAAANTGSDADDERHIYRIGTTEAMAFTVEDCSGCGVHGWGWQDGGYGRRVSGTPLYFNNGGPTTIRVQRREDGISIDQIVFARDDGTAGPYFFSAPGYQKDDDTIVPAQDPDLFAGSLDVLLFPGVDPADLHGAWRTISDSTAAEGARVWHPDAGAAKLTAPLASPVHYFDLHFQASAGVGYRLWIRGKAQNDYWGNDSVFAQFSDSVDADGTPQFRLNTASATTINLEDCSGCGVSAWGWQDNGWGVGVLGPLVYFENDGDHTIRIQTREDGLSIDQILLSPVRYRNWAPGTTKNDFTILSR